MSCMHNSGAAVGLYLPPLNAKVKLFLAQPRISRVVLRRCIIDLLQFLLDPSTSFSDREQAELELGCQLLLRILITSL